MKTTKFFLGFFFITNCLNAFAVTDKKTSNIRAAVTKAAVENPRAEVKPVAAVAPSVKPRVVVKPVAKKSVAEKPKAVVKPVTKNVVAEKPKAVVKPAATKAVAEKPKAVVKPAATKAVAENSKAVVKPAATKSVAEKPKAVVKPVATKSVAENSKAVVKPAATKLASEMPKSTYKDMTLDKSIYQADINGSAAYLKEYDRYAAQKALGASAEQKKNILDAADSAKRHFVLGLHSYKALRVSYLKANYPKKPSSVVSTSANNLKGQISEQDKILKSVLSELKKNGKVKPRHDFSNISKR